jgi:hypothetical protein
MTQTDGAISNGTKKPEQSQKGSVGSPEEPETKTGDKPRASSSSSSSTAELGGMLLAFLFGGVGFAVRILWIPALVVMAVVFGLILAERRSSKTTKGVVPEIVAHVVSEARDIYQAASGSSGEEDSGIEAEESVHDGHHPVSDDERVPAASRQLTVSDGPTQLKALSPISLDGLNANGHSPSQDGAPSPSMSEKDPVASPLETIDGVDDSPSEAETVTIEEESAATASVETESVRTEVTESASVDGDIVTEDGSPDDARTSPREIAHPPTNPLPVRLIISADRMAARNPLLRPVRKRMLGMATSLGQAVVHIVIAPEDPPR